MRFVTFPKIHSDLVSRKFGPGRKVKSGLPRGYRFTYKIRSAGAGDDLPWEGEKVNGLSEGSACSNRNISQQNERHKHGNTKEIT